MGGETDRNNGSDEPACEAGFEHNLKTLENIVSQLEQGHIPLDKALQLYEEGMKAYKNCRRLLEQAEGRVVKLVEALEGELEEESREPPSEGEDQ